MNQLAYSVQPDDDQMCCTFYCKALCNWLRVYGFLVAAAAAVVVVVVVVVVAAAAAA
jgi:hypothetical protein